jgi:hypothetical protein
LWNDVDLGVVGDEGCMRWRNWMQSRWQVGHVHVLGNGVQRRLQGCKAEGGRGRSRGQEERMRAMSCWWMEGEGGGAIVPCVAPVE